MYICENGTDKYGGLIDLLSIVLAKPVIRVFYNIQATFEHNLNNLERQISAQVRAATDRACVWGCTLGGYFAMHMRHEAVCHAVAINPLVFPTLQWRNRLPNAIQDSYQRSDEQLSIKHRRDVVLFTHTQGLDAELAHSHYLSADAVIKMPCTPSDVDIVTLASIINYDLMPHSFEEGWRGAYIQHDELRSYVGEYNAISILPLHTGTQNPQRTAENIRICTGFLNLAGVPWLLLNGANLHRPALMLPYCYQHRARYDTLCLSLARRMCISQILNVFADGSCLIHHSSNGTPSSQHYQNKGKRIDVVCAVENFLSKHEPWTLQNITPCMQSEIAHGSQKILQQAFTLLMDHDSDPVQRWLESVPL